MPLMDASPEFEGDLTDLAAAAAARWASRTKIRTERVAAADDGRATDSDSRDRLAQRLNNLLDDVRRTSAIRGAPASPMLRGLVERSMPVAADEVTDEVVNEVVVGARNFLSVEFFERGQQASRCVGQVLIGGGGEPKARGTGFLVAPGLMLTNEHVLRTRDIAARCVLAMGYEANRFGEGGSPETFALDPARFFLNDRGLDYALVAVAARSERGRDLADYGWLTLDGRQGKILVQKDDYLNIIQHPLGREKEVVLRDNRVLDLRTDAGGAEMGPFIHYAADTEKGSSGSPVFNDQWQVVALHHSGVPATNAEGRWLDKEGLVWNRATQSVEALCWVANEGVRVSSLIASLDQAKLDPPQALLLDGIRTASSAIRPPIPTTGATVPEGLDLPHMGTSGSAGLGKTARGRRSVAGEHAAGGRSEETLEVEIPVRISVRIGGARTSSAAPSRVNPGPKSTEMAADALLERLDPDDFADRDGFDRDFLGVRVPMPKVRRSPRFGRLLRIPRPSRPEDVHELRYRTYSVLMNETRRLAYVSACNIDFEAPGKATRETGTAGWKTDPRLDNAQQLDNGYYRGNDYDKGHLTRRDDAAWGATDDAAAASSKDTFFYTNAAPQYYLFNQADDFTGAGLDLWGDLENHVTSEGRAQGGRLVVFNGPVFGDADKPLKDILVPTAYFKIVVWNEEDAGTGAVGFVLEQGDLIANLREEGIDPGRFAVSQRRIADIERLLDLDFGPVRGWDRFGTPGEEALDGDEIPIARMSDIRLQ